MTAYLLAQPRSSSVSRRLIQRRLFLFSAAAPLTTILTALILGGIQLPDGQMTRYMGMLLLFSGGSFLYVAAVHVLPDVLRPLAPERLMTYEEERSNHWRHTIRMTMVIGKGYYEL